MAKRAVGLSRVGADLNQTLRALEIDGAAREAVAVALWSEVVGEQFAASTRAVGLRGGVMEVLTRSSGWSNELAFHKGEILGRLNRRLGAPVVTDLRFRVGDLPSPPPGGPPAPSADEIGAILVPPAIQSAIERQAQHPDHDLAALVHRALTRRWQLDEWRRQHGYQPCRKCRTLCEPPRTLCPMCARDAPSR